MTTTPRHPLVEQYLGELERRSANLAPEARRELLAEIRDHVDAGAAEARSEADIRNMLESLGSSEDIVSESEPDNMPSATATATGPTGRLALGFGITALILVPTGYLAIPPGLAAVILGIRARNRLRAANLPTSTATAGAITGGIAVVLVVLLFAFLVSGRSTTGGPEPVESGPASTLMESPTTTGVG